MKISARDLGKYKWPVRVLALLFFLLTGPLSILAYGDLDLETHWSEASNSGTGQATTPDTEQSALIQVYGARAYNWRGAFGIHTWIATKRRNAAHYSIYQVIAIASDGTSTVADRR